MNVLTKSSIIPPPGDYSQFIFETSVFGISFRRGFLEIESLLEISRFSFLLLLAVLCVWSIKISCRAISSRNGNSMESDLYVSQRYYCRKFLFVLLYDLKTKKY